jgi:signal transduction histidine kinase
VFKGKLLNPNYMVKSDMDRISQVLMNIQSNALKFTKEGYVKIEVSMSIEN